MGGVCEGECMGCSPRDEPLTLTRCHSYIKPLKGGIRLWPTVQLKGHKGENFCFSSHLKLCSSFTVAHFLA